MQNIRITRSPLSLPSELYSRLPLPLCDAICRCGAPRIEEIRLHGGRYATVSCGIRNYSTGILLSPGDPEEILYKLCNGSRYAFSDSINQGYLTLDGGIRVGVCGTAATQKGQIIGVSEITGLILRLPNVHSVDTAPLLTLLRRPSLQHGFLIYAPPGVGKTTLLRSLAMDASGKEPALRTVVVDSRCEFSGTLEGERLLLDVLVGYPKELGIGIAVRSLGAQLILCDEIGTPQEAHALLFAANCGVPIIATAHAASPEELLRRPTMYRLHEAEIFTAYVGLERDLGGGFRYHITPHGEIAIGGIQSREKEAFRCR